MTHIRCDMSKCDQPAEARMTWLIHTGGLDKTPERVGGNYCGSCAAMVWDRVSRNDFTCSSAILEEPRNMKDASCHVDPLQR